jgi:Arf-GAP/coiled-coil/ANK repeat/PH domain-containing protein
MLNGAKVDQKDQHGQTPLHHATLMGHTGQVCQFLKRNANQHAVDADGNVSTFVFYLLARTDDRMNSHVKLLPSYFSYFLINGMDYQ